MTQALKRSEVIEALSWAEDMQRGRWGYAYATEVLEAHEAAIEAQVRVRLAAEIAAFIIPGAVTRDYQIGNDAYRHARRIADGTDSPTA
jgi:hypothetical protein